MNGARWYTDLAAANDDTWTHQRLVITCTDCPGVWAVAADASLAWAEEHRRAHERARA